MASQASRPTTPAMIRPGPSVFFRTWPSCPASPAVLQPTISLAGASIEPREPPVVWAPKITEPIDGQVLQLSGDVTEEQAKEIAQMLRDES